VLIFARTGKYGVSFKSAWLYCLIALPLCYFGGHLAYCLVQPGMILADHSIGHFFAPWQGQYEFLMYGVLAMMALAAFISTKCFRGNMRSLLDLCVFPAALLIAVIRLSEPLFGMGGGELLGNDDGIVNPLFFAVSYMKDADYPEEQYLAVFAIEAFAAVCMAVYAAADRSRRVKGEKALLFMVQYSSCQVLFEYLRTDGFALWRFVHISQILSAVFLFGVLIISAIRCGKWKNGLLRGGAFILTAGVCVGFAFLDDKPLRIFGTYINVSHPVCCLAVAVCGILLGCIAWRMYRKCVLDTASAAD